MAFWQTVDTLKRMRGARIAELLQDDALSAAKTIALDELVFDFAKTSITRPAWAELVRLAAPVVAMRDAMFAGVIRFCWGCKQGE